MFLSGKGMPVSDLEFGKDGAMYFTVGGRGTQGGLYRVSYPGSGGTSYSFAKPLPVHEPWRTKFGNEVAAESESIQNDGPAQPLLDLIKNAFVSGDRFKEFHARNGDLGRLFTALQPNNWEDSLPRAQAARIQLNHLLGAARTAPGWQEHLLRELTKFPFDSLNDELKLFKLRVIKVSFARQGRPAEELVKLGVEKLIRQYPAKTFALNRELSELLIWLTRSGDAPVPSVEESASDGTRASRLLVIDKTLALLESSPAQEEQIWYACMLREAAGWTRAQRERYFAWFAKARAFKGGNSAPKFIARIRDDALAHVPEAERAFFAALADGSVVAEKVAPPRPFVKAWTVADLAPDLDKISTGRNFARGKEMYAAAQCAICHLFGGQGGNLGPDLTAVSSRFNRRDLLEAIVDPNKGLSEQYPVYRVTQFDGKKDVAGMIIEENNEVLKVLVDPLRGTAEAISKFRPPKRELLPISPMPPGLLSTSVERGGARSARVSRIRRKCGGASIQAGGAISLPAREVRNSRVTRRERAMECGGAATPLWKRARSAVAGVRAHRSQSPLNVKSALSAAASGHSAKRCRSATALHSAVLAVERSLCRITLPLRRYSSTCCFFPRGQPRTSSFAASTFSSF